MEDIQTMLSTLDPQRLSRKEFTDAFALVVKKITELKKSNEQEWTLIHSALQMFQTKLQTTHTQGLSTFTDATNTHMQSRLSTIEDQVNTKLQAVDAKLATVVNGKDADSEQIIADVLSQIQLPEQKELLLDTPEDIRNKLEVLQGDDRLSANAIAGLEAMLEELKTGLKTGSQTGWGAHPLTVAKSGTTKSKTTRHINFTGSGVSSVVRNPDGTVDVTISSGGGFTTLTATETPNSNIKIFTFSGASAQPSYLVVDNVWLQATTAAGTVNWTWNNGTKKATLTIPPNDDIWAVV